MATVALSMAGVEAAAPIAMMDVSLGLVIVGMVFIKVDAITDMNMDMIQSLETTSLCPRILAAEKLMVELPAMEVMTAIAVLFMVCCVEPDARSLWILMVYRLVRKLSRLLRSR